MRIRRPIALLARLPIALASVALLLPCLDFASAQTPAAPAATPAAPVRPAPTPEQLAQQAASAADHQQMMDQLHIASIRGGANGTDPTSPTFANYDESKANPFPHLPDALVLNDGKKVTTAKMWWKERRPEIVEMFDREVYGRVPAHTPSVKWEVVSTKTEKSGDFDVVTKRTSGARGQILELSADQRWIST